VPAWGRAFQLTNLFPNAHGAGERAAGGAGAALGGRHWRGLNLWSIWSDYKALADRSARDEILAGSACAMQVTAGRSPCSQPAAWRPAQARGGAADGARAARSIMFDEPTAGMSVDEAPVILT
jgi:branched-chain amino acid transport system ATP-binding protein